MIHKQSRVYSILDAQNEENNAAMKVALVALAILIWLCIVAR